MSRLVVGVFFLLHGFVYLLYAAHSQRLFELQPGMVWPDGSWAFSRLFGTEATRWLASLSYALAGLGFVVGGAGLLASRTWWRPITAAMATFSALMIILFWNGKMERLPDQGAIAVLLNAATLIATLLVQ